MNPNLPIPSLGYDPHPQTPLLPTDVSSSVLAPGSGSSSSETELESSPKRQKIDEDDGGDVKGSGGEEEEEWTQTMKKPLTWYPKTEEDEKKMSLFYDQVLASEGFDYVQQPPVDVVEYGVLRVNMKNAGWRKLVHECLDHVVDQMNKSPDGGWKLVAGDIVKANRRAVQGCIFFITFKATNFADPKDAAEKEYEAQVYRNFTGECRTDLFRVKGQKEAIQERPNRWRMRMCYGCPCDGSCGCK
ncbi:unnamed protein product [Linum trigynum]|uniref:Uncharacterized protein n=1 Tax=Linum trigynum TaxID=586398 RepID=A0AAV2C7H0_9ROSI